MDTCIIVRDWGEWVGRKAPGSRVAESMEDRKITPGLSLCPGGNHPVIVFLGGPGPYPPLGKKAEAPRGKMLGTGKSHVSGLL